ncbi:MAG: cytochrome P450 [Deltaproteobacteria bacterium]|nr:cytochrome P450 [Deltaproteobacteria bacterium]
MAVAPASLNDLELVNNETYAADGYPHEAWAVLRREAPVYWYERDVKVPFWAITKHEDIRWISRQPERMLNAPRLAVFPEFAPPEEDERVARHLLNMDDPDHGSYRKLAAPQFTPRAVRRMAASVERIAVDLLDDLAGDGEEREMDFVTALAAPLSLAVLADLLGVPRSDWELMFRWTNAIIGSNDPEYQIAGGPQQSAGEARKALFEYFWAMAEERRRNPGEFEKLRRDASLVDSAVEEILRWTTPVIQFCRTATESFELRGQKIRAGDSMCLFYPSANRDEDVFDDPFVFRVDRNPNRHLAFGIGEHFCLGANLARLELRILFRLLAERLEHAELTGPMERLASSFLGGVKHVPLRYRLV